MSVAKLDPSDRRFILLLNDQAATFRKLAEVTTGPSREIYLAGLGAYLTRVEFALEAALRRCAA